MSEVSARSATFSPAKLQHEKKSTQRFKYQKTMDSISEIKNSKHAKMFQFENNARESQQDKITSFFLFLSCMSSIILSKQSKN